jgi:hypothetical protein
VDGDVFLRLAEELTGTPVKDVTDSDRAVLGGLLADEGRKIDHSQLNELLLLVNKDRMERPFFDWFFGSNCRVGTIAAAVTRFQKTAMLCYGNFIYAYRTLSRLRSVEELKRELGEIARDSPEMVTHFSSRSTKLVDVATIARSETPLVGYLSAGEIIAEAERVKLLIDALPDEAARATTSWEAYRGSVLARAKPVEHRPLVSMIANYCTHFADKTVADFASFLQKADSILTEQSQLLMEVRRRAARNQDIYLTWDHMDVYFATSMRKRWEYEDLFDFVNALMARPEFADLKLRHFDPTQAYTENRVNKGLVESLMLKRAKCTVYSVQDTDTLGKDSELAATLAQGKPVIAYIPTIDVEARTNSLVAEDPATVQERLRFVLYADEQFAQSTSEEDLAFLRSFVELERFERERVLRAVPSLEAVAQFRQAHGTSLRRVCKMIAASEQRIYDKRARTLRETHPLAIQVHLESGVANGLRVVRTIPDCAKLLRSILIHSMEFELDENSKDRMWYLRERISGCVYRVVSKDRRLTNCFWNFYRQP